MFVLDSVERAEQARTQGAASGWSNFIFVNVPIQGHRDFLEFVI